MQKSRPNIFAWKRQRPDFAERVAHPFAIAVHANEKFDFIPGRYIEPPEAIAAEAETPYEKALSYVHDAIENPVEDQLKIEIAAGQSPSKAREELLINQHIEKLAKFCEGFGFTSETEVDRGITVADFLDDLNYMSRRRIDVMPDAARRAEYLPYIESTDAYKKYVAKVDKGMIAKLHEYMGYIHGLAEHALNVGRIGMLKTKKRDIRNNSLSSRNPVFLEGDTAPGAVKIMAKLGRYDIALGYLGIRVDEITRDLEYQRTHFGPILHLQIRHPHRPIQPYGVASPVPHHKLAVGES